MELTRDLITIVKKNNTGQQNTMFVSCVFVLTSIFKHGDHFSLTALIF